MPETRTRILIVDDRACTRTRMSFVLAEIGYRVRTVKDGLSAVYEIRREIPEILLADLNMPGMSGLALLSVIRCRFPAILVIAMSDRFSGNEVPSGIPADAFYQKGSSTNALLHILRAPPQMKRPVPQLCRTVAPILIQRDASDPSGKGQVTIACPGCLTAFPQALDGFGSLMLEVDCNHCDNSIQYAVVEPSDRMPVQPIRREAGATISANGISTIRY
ncbi:MAG: response regulator [Terracidiphilus sp.]